MEIRVAMPEDRDAISAIHLSAFPEGEREVVAGLAVALLDLEQNPGTLNLVAEEEDGELVGHVVFSPVSAEEAEGFRGAILAPLAVSPGFQKRGVGGRLIQEGIRCLREQSADALVVYGDPAYYGRFGFTVEAGKRYRAPYPLEMPFGWQGMEFATIREEVLHLRCVPALQKPDLW